MGKRDGPFSYTWSFALCPHRVQIDLAIIEALQGEMAASSDSVQGLLFGQTGRGTVEINGWWPIPALNRERIAGALETETRDVRGYYVIREGSAFILSPAEIALAQEFFSKPGSVVLLIERRRKGPAEATFYFWRGDVLVHNLPLPFPLHAGILSGQPPVPAEDPVLAPAPSTGIMSGRGRALVIALYAASAVAGAGIVATQFRHHQRPAVQRPELSEVSPPADATWISAEPKRDLELTWDPRAESVANATAGVLKIEDGGVTRQMSLDVGELLLGAVLYAPASDRIGVQLTVLQRDGRMLPAPIAAQPAAVSPPAPVAAAAPASEPARKDPVPAPEAVTKKPEVLQQTAAVRRPALKRFTWTRADRAAPSVTPVLEIPPQAPPVVNPAVLTAELPHGALVSPTLPAPPPPRPTPSPVPAAPAKSVSRVGRVIWTGTLLRRGVVELDGRSASVGSVTGALPGAPINLSVTPAEFGPDGLMVYTTDASRHNRVEPPSAGNGWNKVTYVWAPERVREIAVLESPSPANGFNRLALRSDARRCSMLLIDWSLR